MKALQVKDFLNEGYGQKDLVRMEDIRTKSAGDHDKELALASTQARLITKAPKAKARAEAAEQVFGPGSDIANIFGQRAIELGGSYVSSQASSGTLAPLTSAEPKAERKFKTNKHLASERVKKGGDDRPVQTGGFTRGGGAMSGMGIGRYADAVETSDEHIWHSAPILPIGRVNLGTGDNDMFNVISNFDNGDGTAEIWEDYKGNKKLVITSGSPSAKIGNTQDFKHDQTWKSISKDGSWKLIDYAPINDLPELVRLYGASLPGYVYK